MKTKNTLALMVLTATTLVSGYAAANIFSTSSEATTQSTPAKSNVVVPDTTLTTNVRTALAADKTVSALSIHVNTSKGIVMLTGNIDTDEQASAAIQDAMSVEGVKDVDASKLVIKKSIQPYTDTVITAKIRGSFLREQLFGSASVPVMSITVETTNGNVYLSGTADNQAEADEAVTIAKSIDGVKNVQTTVKIKA
ncbi:MAG: BON domain-containing protein [Gammaproteobacteria bacterium]|nr:BON domain-containing protein [Gammaproteobacteria bacterium]